MVTVGKIGGQSVSNTTDFYGLSTDTKPTEGVPNGSTFFAIDEGKVYMFDASSETWMEI